MNDVVRLATVSALFENGAPQITFDGESVPSKKEYSQADGFNLAVGDRVILLRIGKNYIINSKLKRKG